jgi:hypothetical protein
MLTDDSEEIESEELSALLSFAGAAEDCVTSGSVVSLGPVAVSSSALDSTDGEL